MNSASSFKLQLAIQGGGAKLFALIAALEAVQKLETDGKLKITRIAGTSAGAIAGALYAAQVPMNVVKERLSGLANTIDTNIPMPSKLIMGWRLVWGVALWKEDWLKKELETMFSYSPIKSITKFSALGIPMYAIATDIKNGAPIIRKDDDYLINGLLDSCALPYAFRAANSGGDSNTLDGGLCDNLPSYVLQPYARDDGPVVGISFVRKPGNTPTSVLDFSKCLLNAAIDTSMERARIDLEEACLEIDTSVDTFDFKKAFTDGITNSYTPITTSASGFFKRFVETKLEQQRDQGARAHELKGDPWKAATYGDHWAKEYTGLMQEIWRMYQLQHSGQTIAYNKGVIIYTARSLIDSNMPDETLARFEFTIDEPLLCHAIQLAHAPTRDQLEKSEVWVSSKSGPAINTIKLPMEDPTEVSAGYSGDDGSLKRALLLCFNPVLSPVDGPFEILYKNIRRGGLIVPLREKGKEEIAVRAQRSNDTMHRMEIKLVLYVPAETNPMSDIDFKQMRLVPKDYDEEFPNKGRLMTKDELAPFKQSAPPNFRPLGWIGEDVVPRTNFGVDVYGF